jgi:hypothetical protein
LERYRRTGKLGWQNGHPFEKEISQVPGEESSNGGAQARLASPQPTLFG